MTIDQYIASINQRYKLGNATEHTFRGDLQQLIESIGPEIRATNEPKRQSCGAPDYILTKKDIPVGFIEAKDIGDKDLEGAKKTGNKEQFDRYKASLSNLIFTDYINFLLYRDGQFISKITIATSPDPSKGGEIRAIPENFASFENLIKDFCTHIGQTIKSSKKLAEMMAGKARLLSDVIEKALTSDEEHQEDSTLKDQMMAFQQILIHDITPKGFADVYAQTIAYGMFAARLHDPTLPTFSRQEAAELIPKSNPFLRKLFGYIAGPDIDDRIKWIVDSLVEIFLACNVEEILKNYGKSTKMEDPIIHFYETFLSEYDPKLRKARGVWYTPQPVVNFIVRAVDDILKTEFGLSQGLADTSKTKITLNTQTADKRSTTGYKQIEHEVHRVQILDPATGTGTFLAEVVKHVYSKFKGQQGIWSNYVETHLLPRLNGFELLMASYAMAHLKLDLLLKETGYDPSKSPRRGDFHPSSGGGVGGGRLRVYLTNSLEEHHPDTGTLFANWLSSEANEANRIKRDTPVMVVMGNPPYSVSSSNKSEWIEKLTADYKKNLNERNIQPLSDDYIKFIRFGQHFIDKNGSGILAYISNNSFIDGIIHRQMRKNLLESFDSIYILDLHGNSKKKETCPDGSADQNVFDIMQGVSINLFVKTGKKKKSELGKVFQFDLFGKREFKYDYLQENSLKSFEWNELNPEAPNYYLVKKDFEGSDEYEKGFKIDELFLINASGIKTQRDDASIKFTREECQEIKHDFLNLSNNDLIRKYGFKDVRDWTIENAKSDLTQNKVIADTINYRVFDLRSMNYTGKTKGVMGYPRNEVMKNLQQKNYSLISTRQLSSFDFQHIFITKYISDINSISLQTKEISFVFPLYLYPEATAQQTIELNLRYSNVLTPPNLPKGEASKGASNSGIAEEQGLASPSFGGVGEVRTPNLNMGIVKQIAERLGLSFVPEKETPPNRPNGEALKSASNSIIVDKQVPESLSVEGVGEVEPKAGYNTANPRSYGLIKDMRDEMKDSPTEAEKIIWEFLRNKKTGHKIRRQHIIDDFIPDFVCLSKKVAIEIDGKIHLQQKEYDQLRTERLNYLGYEVIRFTNGEVFANPQLVASKIKEVLDKREDLQKDDESERPFFGEEKTPPNLPRGEALKSASNSIIVDKQVPESPSVGGVGEVDVFAPIDLLDYIYAVLHSPTYREKYKEFLKIDFPRVPYPKDRKTFCELTELGSELRQIHLMESPILDDYVTQYPVDGDNVVTKVAFQLYNYDTALPDENGNTEYPDYLGAVYINETQYFADVPLRAWEFYIGGYQPAQKWLKDRKGRKLEFEDILHYQKIIVALSETDRLMKEIDGIEIE